MVFGKGHKIRNTGKTRFKKGHQPKHKFEKGNKINLGRKHSEEWKQESKKRMKGNTFGFKKGELAENWSGFRKGHKTWNKGLTKETDERVNKYTLSRRDTIKNNPSIMKESGKKHGRTLKRLYKEDKLISPRLGKHLSREQIEKQRNKMIGRKHTEEAKRKMREWIKINNPRLGKKFPKELYPNMGVRGFRNEIVLPKKDTSIELKIIFGVLLVLTITFVLAFTINGNFSTFDFLDPTPANGSYIYTNTPSIVVNVSLNNLSTNGSAFIDFNGSLLGYWSMDYSSATGVYDNSTHNKFGTFKGNLTSSSVVAGVRGNGLTFNGEKGYLQTPTNLGFNMSNGGTISAWINLAKQPAGDYNHSQATIISLSTGDQADFTVDGSLRVHATLYNTTYVNVNSGSISLNTWYFVTYAWNKTHIDIYINGVKNVSAGYGYIQDLDSLAWIGSKGTTQYTRNWNGTLDEVSVFNRRLSDDEISAMYNFQGSKLINFTTTLDYGIYNYSVFVENQTGGLDNSGTLNFNYLRAKNITANFSNQIGNVRDDFYGVGMQGTKLISGSIDTNCDGTSETPRNYTWQRDTFLNGGAKIAYYDIVLDSYYSGLNNRDMEYWTNASVGYFNSSKSCGAYGWNCQVDAGGSAFSYQSTDSHTMNYSLNITGNSTTVYAGATVVLKEQNKIYNFSVWLKGSGTVSLFRNFYSPWQNLSSVNIVLNNETWQQASITVNTSTFPNGTWSYGILGIGVGEYVLIDDFDLTEDGEDYWYYSGNLDNIKNQITSNYNDGITSMVIMEYTPLFQANRTSNCIDNSTDSDYSDCMAKNIQIIADISLDAYKRVDQYRNDTYVQFHNEPDGGFFEDNLASNSAKTDFVIWYNTSYTTFQNYNSNIVIAGYRGLSGSVTTTSLSAFTRMMISNLSSQFKRFGYHPYDTAYIGYSSVSDEIDYLLTQCAIYGAECSHIFLDEWQPSSQTLKNASLGQSDLYKANIAYFLQDLMNGNKSSIVTEIPYHWDDSVSYFNCPSRYSEYPSFWSSVSEAGLDNATSPVLYPTYTVIKKFAELCKINGGIYNTLDDDNSTVSCKKGNHYSLISINSKSYTENNTICMGSDYPSDNITDYDSKEVYTLTGSNKCLSKVQDSNNILYLTEDLQPPTITINSPTSSTYSQTNIDFNITLDEEGSWCGYSLNSGSNISMNKQGVIFDFQKTVSITNGNHKVVFTCNDTSNNYNSTNISFTVYKSGGFGGGGESGYGGSSCNPLWICEQWSSCSNNLRSRNCVDISYCNSNENPPLLLSCSLPLPSDRISGCVRFQDLNILIYGWKKNIYRFDILDEAIWRWRGDVGC